MPNQVPIFNLTKPREPPSFARCAGPEDALDGPVTKHECWWVCGDLATRAPDAPIYRAIEVRDDMSHWTLPDDLVGKVKATGWVGMLDVRVATYLCQLTPSSWVQFLYPFCEVVDGLSDDEAQRVRERMDELQREDATEGDYYDYAWATSNDRTFVEAVPGCPVDPEISRDDEWGEQAELWRGNCPL